MYKIKIFSLLFVLLIITGLTLIPTYSDPTENIQTLPNKTKVNSDLPNLNSFDITYKYLGTMKASWYGPGFHGKLTANGEIYDQMGFTAAHKSFPFGTLLKLTNPRNNKSIIVRINDRGPYIKGRQIDLSKKAAIELGTFHKGVVKLKVEQIKISGVNSALIN